MDSDDKRNLLVEIISKDKCPGIFSPQMEIFTLTVFQIFFEKRAVLKFGNFLGCSPVLAGEYQSRASKNISWIIKRNNLEKHEQYRYRKLASLHFLTSVPLYI